MKKYVLSTFTSTILFAFCLSQVPVSKEPMHHNLLDNGHVRLLDVHIGPGDTTQFHIHATPSVFVILTNIKTGSQVIQEEDHRKSPITHYGNIYFEGFYQLPRIHRVWNSSTSDFNVMDIELPNKNYITIDPPIQLSTGAFSFLFEEKPVRAYRLNLVPGMQISLSPRKADILMIQLTDSDALVSANEKLFHKKGDFIYIPYGKPIGIKSDGKENASFAFFELK